MGLRSLIVLVTAVVTLGCSTPPVQAREFPLTGTVVTIRPDHREVTVTHDEVKGFMDAMTMPFSVKDPSLVAELKPGDVIAATLVLTNEESYLTAIRRTAAAPPPGHSPAPPR